jgi:small basic protein
MRAYAREFHRLATVVQVCHNVTIASSVAYLGSEVMTDIHNEIISPAQR